MPPQLSQQSALALLPKIPAVARLRVLKELYGRLLSPLNRLPQVKFVTILKHVACLIFILNIGSMPFAWHFRVYWPIIRVWVGRTIVWLRLITASKKERNRRIVQWCEDLSPVGTDPFEIMTVTTEWSTLDDNDFFGKHLSNSSYAKSLDRARTQSFVDWIPAWGLTGGTMAIGASSFHFIREIPPLARYEIRLSIAAWDHKWLYAIARFVTRPSGRKAKNLSPKSTGNPSTPNEAHTLAQNGSANLDHALNAIIQADRNGNSHPRRAPILEPDGSVLHCVAVTQLVFKQGRLTTPPALVLATNGFTKPSSDGAGIHDNPGAGQITPYSPTNPPPSWLKTQELRIAPHGSQKKIRAFFTGGWRDVPEGQRWWEDALGGSVEVRRQANLEIIESLRRGLDAAREVRG